jgi:hypothetical protein
MAAGGGQHASIDGAGGGAGDDRERRRRAPQAGNLTQLLFPGVASGVRSGRSPFPNAQCLSPDLTPKPNPGESVAATGDSNPEDASSSA